MFKKSANGNAGFKHVHGSVFTLSLFFTLFVRLFFFHPFSRCCTLEEDSFRGYFGSPVTLASTGKHAWLSSLSGLLVLGSSLWLFSTHLPESSQTSLPRRIFSRAPRVVRKCTYVLLTYVIHCQRRSFFLDHLIFFHLRQEQRTVKFGEPSNLFTWFFRDTDRCLTRSSGLFYLRRPI